MNHAELSRDLALAIGWKYVYPHCPDTDAAWKYEYAAVSDGPSARGTMLPWRKFDYRSPGVWGPVLEWLMREHRFPAYWSRIAEKFVIPGADNRIECDTLPEAVARAAIAIGRAK